MTWKEAGLSFQVAFERMTLASVESTQESTQETLSKQSLAVLQLLREDVHITRNQIAEKLSVSPETIKKHLTKLRRLGYIEHVGSTKNGYWKMLK